MLDVIIVYQKLVRRYVVTGLMLSLSMLVFQQTAWALVINVTDPAGSPVSGFRYLVEQDTTHPVTPGIFVSDSLSLGIHRSYAPVAVLNDGTAASGHVVGSTSPQLDLSNGQRWVVSVLPDSGYSNGAANVAIDQDQVTVIVNPLPIPTAQISVLVFKDDHPINDIPDQPQEKGLKNFTIKLSDAAGQLLTDVFGNPLGTKYQMDASGNFKFKTDGSPAIKKLGTGDIRTNWKGEALVKFIAPGKYGVQAIPPAGKGWVQTNTIEGTHTIDAWVRAGEPADFGAFGPPNKHVFFGFIRKFNKLPGSAVTGTLTGKVVNAHNSAPPDFTFNAGHPLPNCWIGLNEVASRKGVFAKPCKEDSTFRIPNVPPGDYQLVIWDTFLDNIFTIQGVTVPPTGGKVALGDVPVFRWFGALESYVFFDRNQNGFRDCFAADGVTASGDPADCDDAAVDDVGIPEQTVNLRFRDGSIYQTYPTDLEGFVPFDEVFPFLKFLVAEVDFARLKATGATVITDGGGPVLPDQGWDYPSRGKLTPQPQCEARDPALGTCVNPIVNPNTGNNLSRTETGVVLLEGMQTFLGLTNVIEWGKGTYAAGENGGISGIVYYATTRAEDDPRFAAGEEWEPGIPRAQVNLYLDSNRDDVIDDLNGDGGVTLADVDNHPFGNFPGNEDTDRNGNGSFDPGDAAQFATTDSWDDSLPTGCQAVPFSINGGQAQDCFESLRTFNQVRGGVVFDGGYAFETYSPGGIASGSAEAPLPSGKYIVEAVTPPGYIHVKEEDRNVDFGQEFTPSPQLLPPSCVGEPHVVPAELSLFPGEPSIYAGQTRPLCDRKAITLSNSQNAAVDFFMFTEVPKAGRVVGFLLNDFANVFDPNHPWFGEKAAPPWLPISIQDFAGTEVARVYSDEFGLYNALLPSTYSVHIPTATGVSPNMLRVCLNHPGPIPNPDDPKLLITDPRFDPAYTQVCYTFDNWPGKTTYLDTPVLPVVATAGRTDYPLDCEVADGIPEIYSVSGPGGGPHVSAPGQQITITSAILNGLIQVPNPVFEAGTGTAQTIPRSYGFGNVLGTVTIGGVPLTNVNWGDVAITATVPAGVQTGELVVIRGDNGRSTNAAVTVTVGGPAPIRVPVGGSIQAAIDAATPGSLILVPPGTYNELLVMWKNVQLQGWGPYSTILDASKTSANLLAWQARVDTHIAAGEVDLIPGQTGLSNLEEGPGIIVLAKNGAFGSTPNARIDGFTIRSATEGGAILANGYASNLEISNNRIVENQGTYGGGIRIGQPFLPQGGGFVYADAFNDAVRIHNNHIARNGLRAQAGGGIALYTGSDGYQVTNNFICGNFSAQDGGGIGHLGLSDGGLIADNDIVFNQVFQQTAGAGGGGGGIMITGGVPLGGETLSTGSGSVSIVSNKILGNQAGADDGGGILLRYINGEDTAAAPSTWYSINVFNNVIANNISGLAGAVTLIDTLNTRIINNTIVNNDSTSTSAAAFSTGPSVSTAQPAGVVARAHTPALATALGVGDPGFSNPVLSNNIVWHNRSFYWDVSQNGGQGGLVPDVAAGNAPVYSDLAVLGTTGALNPTHSLLTSTAGYDTTNVTGDPQFIAQYANGGPSHLLKAGPETLIQTIPAFDEGGNFIDLSFGPLTLINPATGTSFGDYHLQGGSPALDVGDSGVIGSFLELGVDIDGDTRPNGLGTDIGADEHVSAVAGILGSPGEQGGSGGQGDGQDGLPAKNTPTRITLKWNPVPEKVTGYRVYYGASKKATRKVASEVPAKPAKSVYSAKYRAWKDLRLASGKRVCFQVTAFVADVAESEKSDALCIKV